MPFRRAAIAAAFCVVSLGWTGCGNKETKRENFRLLVQRFENQSDSRTHDQLAASTAESVIWALAADPVAVASAALDREQARSSQAGLWLEGQLRQAPNGQFALTAQLLDGSSAQLLEEATIVAPASRWFEQSCPALLALVRKHIPAATGACFGSTSDWTALSTEGGPARLAAASSHFWPAYVTETQVLLRAGQRDAAQQLLARLGEPTERPGQLARARMLSLLATNPAEKLAALDRSLQIRSADLRLREEAAQLAQSAGQWSSAVQHWRALLQVEAKRPDAWNSLGYAEAQLGKTDNAVAAILEYRKLAPAEANPWDSLGEVQYMGRRFRDAAQAFDELNRRHPNFMNRNGLWKAALAWYRAGNLAEADRRYDAWLAPLQPQMPPSAMALQRAYWLARTGRQQEMKALWNKELAESSGQRRLAAQLHQAMIEFGLTRQAPPRAQFLAWSKELQEPSLRQEFAFLGLLSEDAGSPAAWQARMQQAVGGSAGQAMAAQLVAVGLQIWAPDPPSVPLIEAPPENPPGPLDVLLLRKRIAVLR